MTLQIGGSKSNWRVMKLTRNWLSVKQKSNKKRLFSLTPLKVRRNNQVRMLPLIAVYQRSSPLFLRSVSNQQRKISLLFTSLFSTNKRQTARTPKWARSNDNNSLNSSSRRNSALNNRRNSSNRDSWGQSTSLLDLNQTSVLDLQQDQLLNHKLETQLQVFNSTRTGTRGLCRFWKTEGQDELPG